MSFRILTLFLAVSVCALWPQGLVLCLSGGGHLEFEPAGAPCCPDESEHEEEPADDCSGCVDFESPELTSSTVVAKILPPAPTQDSPFAADLLAPGGEIAPVASFVAHERETVVLTV